jgi:hypothetical protein
MDVTLSAQHDELIRELYKLRQRLGGLSRSERLILEMSIMMLEHLDEYAADAPSSESSSWSPEQAMRAAGRGTESRRQSRLRWTVDDFDQLICSGGFDLDDGVLVPRF